MCNATALIIMGAIAITALTGSSKEDSDNGNVLSQYDNIKVTGAQVESAIKMFAPMNVGIIVRLDDGEEVRDEYYEMKLENLKKDNNNNYTADVVMKDDGNSYFYSNGTEVPSRLAFSFKVIRDEYNVVGLLFECEKRR